MSISLGELGDLDESEGTATYTGPPKEIYDGVSSMNTYLPTGLKLQICKNQYKDYKGIGGRICRRCHFTLVGVPKEGGGSHGEKCVCGNCDKKWTCEEVDECDCEKEEEPLDPMNQPCCIQ
jgi:hypothetical protein